MEKIIEEVIRIGKKRLGIRQMKQIFCLLLMGTGIEKETIKEKIGVSESSIKKYKKMIEAGRINEIFEDKVYRQKSELESHRDRIISEFDKKPPRTLIEAANRIEKMTEIKRSIVSVRTFLKKTVTGV
jgi:transposase